MHGNIVLFPKGGRASSTPATVGRQILSVFEEGGLLLPGTAERAHPTDDCSVTFEEPFEDRILPVGGYAYLVVPPDYLTKSLGALVYVLAEDQDGRPAPIELPALEVTVLAAPVAVPASVYGRMPSELWAAIEFSYEDARLSEEIHRVRDEKHPVLSRLQEVLGTPLGWDVVSY